MTTSPLMPPDRRATGLPDEAAPGDAVAPAAGPVQPIDTTRRSEVLHRTEAFICDAEALFGRRFERVPVLFDLKGRSAGMFKILGKQRFIRYNPWIFAKYYEENLRDTVPHEVAHYIVHEVYPRRGTKPHGWQWRELMARFGADPGVTFDRDLAGVPQRSQRSHRYFCGCQVHEVSTTRHNRVQRRRVRYHCCSCDGLLVFVP